MSQDAVRQFIDKVEEDSALQETIQRAFSEQSDLNLIDLGKEHGFAFTEEEGLQVWEEVTNQEELSDFVLELVSGGSPINCRGSKL